MAGAPSSLGDSESKLSCGGMSALSGMKAWHMAVMRLDRTLIIFWLVL